MIEHRATVPPITTLAQATIATLADALHAAELDARPIAPHAERGVELTVADAYAIQQINRTRRESDGQRLIGRKIGLTSEAM